MLNKLRNRLYKCIEKYGMTDKRTIAASERLDLEVNKNMKGYKNVQVY